MRNEISSLASGTDVIAHYNHSVWIAMELLTPHMLCVLILSLSGAAYSLKFTPNNKFLKTISWQFNLLAECLPESCWAAVSEDIYFFIFRFVKSLTWGYKRGLTSNKPTHYPRGLTKLRRQLISVSIEKFVKKVLWSSQQRTWIFIEKSSSFL